VGEAGSKILVTGATGLIGRRLVASLERDGVALRALSRRPQRARLGPAVEVLGWDGRIVSPQHLIGCRAVVHLAGEPVFRGRLNAQRRRRILSSRAETTRMLALALRETPEASRPGVLISASAVGFYGSRGDEELDETSASGEGFLADVCRQWEAAARAAARAQLRVATLRFGIVLAREGGALPLMALPFRVGLGGKLGNGRQWVPWVHADDAVALIRAALDEEAYGGAVNVVAPQPVRNADLTRALARVLRRPALLPVPAFTLRAALGELSQELLGSRRVLPTAALERGFRFRYETIESALEAELGAARG
jgi:hypothetical protein